MCVGSDAFHVGGDVFSVGSDAFHVGSDAFRCLENPQNPTFTQIIPNYVRWQ